MRAQGDRGDGCGGSGGCGEGGGDGCGEGGGRNGRGRDGAGGSGGSHGVHGVHGGVHCDAGGSSEAKPFWLADAPFERRVRIEMRRVELKPSAESRKPKTSEEPKASGAKAAEDSQPGPMDDGETIGQISGVWVQRDGAHYLRHAGEWEQSGSTYLADSPGAAHEAEGLAEGGGGEGDRTIWKIEPSQLTMIRHGIVRWNLRFRESMTTNCTAFFGDAPIPVRVTTRQLWAVIEANRGCVQVAWDAQFGEDAQSVRLQLRFWELD